MLGSRHFFRAEGSPMSKRRKRRNSASRDRDRDVPFRELPQYRVILHADNAHALMYVVQAVMELTRFHREEATHKMWESHNSGRTRLLATHLELAELYIEQFTERGLSVSLEPAV
jgi:ATP-dependent Clp protease adapter protein ClpS